VTSRRWPATAVVTVLAAAVLAACGSTRASGTGGPATPAIPSLATSASYPDGTWAVLVMGGSAAQHNNFWQVFVRPAGKQATWRLATPVGVASNGGIAVAATGGPSLVAALLPSQDLRFSPLSRSTDNGATWAAAGLLDSPLAATPSALAAAPSGGLIALTRAGSVEVASQPGAAWARLATERSVASSPAARSCGLTGLTAAGYTAAGTALLAGTCTRGGHAGLFAREAGGGWVAAGPALPAALAGHPVTVLQLARSGAADEALLQVGSGRTASLLGAWNTGQAGGWRLSAPYRLAGAQPRSAAVAGQALGVLLRGADGSTARAVTVAGPGAAWQALPALPAGTAALPTGAATLAAGPAGGFQLLTARRGQLSVWAAGSSGWTRSQDIKVSIPYGSSG
jgi:hypothetical protein